jgi:hypothetical protein
MRAGSIREHVFAGKVHVIPRASEESAVTVASRKQILRFAQDDISAQYH